MIESKLYCKCICKSSTCCYLCRVYSVGLVFWFGLVKCQVPTKTALSLPLLRWTGERKNDERLESRDKDRERSLTNYCHGQNRLNLGRKGNLIHHQPTQSRIVRKLILILKHLPPTLPSSSAQLQFHLWCRGTGNGCNGQFITCCLCCSFLLRGRTPHTLPLLQREVPLMGGSSPQTSPM